MNSTHRVGVTIATVVTAATVAAALGIRSYVAAQDAAAQAREQALTAVPQAVDPTASLAPETIYVNPLPTPEVIHVTQTAPPARRVRVHAFVPGSDDGHDGGTDH